LIVVTVSAEGDSDMIIRVTRQDVEDVELQFGERGLPRHEPSENWNLPEPEISTSNMA
jgi:hypothetical protein